MLPERIQSFSKKVLEDVDYDSLTRDKAKMVEVFRIILNIANKLGHTFAWHITLCCMN
jgi:hypothetical protein